MLCRKSEVYLTTLLVFLPVIWGIAILATILAFVACIWMVVSGRLDNVIIIYVIILLVICYSGVFGGKYLLNYMENTVTIFYEGKICIKRYQRADVEISYNELRDSILKKEIKVRKGRLELPYPTGKILVYSFGESAMWGGFYRYINRKCELNIPEISKKDCEVIRKAGMGSVIGSMLGKPMIIFGAFIGIVCMLGECRINSTLKVYLDYYMNYFFSFFNFFGVLGGIFIIIGLILNLIHIWPAKKLFKDSKDIIKVKLF